ncbi:MAG TPA: NAD+ synthase [Bacteroidota bacterium]|nr:NAD+ synthase [Bacteroidota bacterium]
MEQIDHTDENPLHLNTDYVAKMCVDFLRDEARVAGFSKAVLGLSGGIDSAVSAFLAARAYGPENVLAVKMPYRTSSPESLSDADLVAQALGIRTVTVDITPMVEPLFNALSITDNLRRGNIMARERMIVLYDLSQKESALVIGTSNKTEALLGYGTLFGDMASALNPIGDLYKTQVWQLAAALGVPERVVSKNPTADLFEGQTDEADLGFSYAHVDRLLFLMVDDRRSADELGTFGFSADFISSIQRKVRLNQFKRRPPLIAKISHRTINVDFRYVRDWGV